MRNGGEAYIYCSILALDCENAYLGFPAHVQRGPLYVMSANRLTMPMIKTNLSARLARSGFVMNAMDFSGDAAYVVTNQRCLETELAGGPPTALFRLYCVLLNSATAMTKSERAWFRSCWAWMSSNTTPTPNCLR